MKAKLQLDSAKRAHYRQKGTEIITILSNAGFSNNGLLRDGSYIETNTILSRRADIHGIFQRTNTNRGSYKIGNENEDKKKEKQG